MDPPRFINHYRPLFIWLRRCGLPTPWLKKTSLLSRLPLLCYDTFLVLLVSFTIWCYIYSIMNTSISFQELCLLGISFTQYVFSLVITLYYLRFRDRLKLITDDMDSIAEEILRSGLGGVDYLQGLYKKDAKLMALLTSTSLFFSFMTPVLYCLSAPVTGWLTDTYREEPPMPIVFPYNVKLPVVYEFVVLQVSCSIAVSTTKKSATDCLFISLFNIQTDFLKFLAVAKDSLEKEFDSGDTALIRRKIITWAKLHQDILKNIEKLIEIFSPVVIVYSVSVVNIVVCGAFVQVKKDNDNLIQSLSIGAYVVVTILYYFLLSNTADQLTNEAQKLAFVVYSAPWYDMQKSNANMIQLLLTICNRPIEVTAYKAPIFLLNRETFAGFMVSAISAFVTFCQLKDVYG